MIFLWCNTATAESELPPCQGEDSMQWTNCYGSYNDRDITDYIKKNFPKMEELYPNTYYTRDYDGEFGSQPGLRNGHGISNLYLNDELYSTYEGEYFNDQRNGYGVYENIMKSVKYVGEYKDGKKNGQGTHTWPNGDKEVAVYKDGEIVKIVSSNVKKESSGGSKTLTGYTYITMMDKGIADNGIWGTRCNYSDGSYREIKSSDPGGPPPRC